MHDPLNFVCLFVCMCLCMDMPHMYMCPWRPEEWIGFPRTGVTDGCEPPIVGTGN